MDTFARVHDFILRETAKEELRKYSTSALAFGGTKKQVSGYLGPLQKILEKKPFRPSHDRDSAKPKADGAARGWRELRARIGSGF